MYASLEIYEKYFGEGGCFLPKEASFYELGGGFSLYDELLESSSQWYLTGNNILRKEFELAFKAPPISWESKVNALNNVETEKLFSKVTILCHLYRWGSLPALEKEYRRTSIELPKGLCIILGYISKKMERPPCGSLWSTTVSNYQTTLASAGEIVDCQELSAGNITIQHSWFDGYEKDQLENWIKIFVLSEAEGLNTIQIALSIIRASAENDSNSIVEGLNDLYSSIRNLTKIFTRFTNPKNLDRNLWREVIQPTFIWGLKYKGKQLQGASGLQLGVNQVIDLILGVSFNSKIGQAIIESRSYMPVHHQKFISAIDTDTYKFRGLIQTTKNEDVQQAFNRCIDGLSQFRRAHMQVGKIFIKGDGADKKITTTGLSMNLENNPVEEFESDMQDRIIETNDREVQFK